MTDTNETNQLYSVWSEGQKINNYYLPREAAERVAKAWRVYGYTDATIKEEKKGEEN